MPIEVEGADRLEDMAKKIRFLFSPPVLTEIALQLAHEAGQKLLDGVIAQCVAEIYDMPEGTYERTEALLHSHELHKEDAEGFVQCVRIDPTAEALPDQREEREFVTDYAGYVHDGYDQFVFGKPTGRFVEGRPWFDDAYARYGKEVMEYVTEGFVLLSERIVKSL